MTTRTNEELAQAWLAALQDVDAFLPLCAPDAKVWHSTDDIWMTVPDAIQAVHDGGGLPPLSRQSYTVTEEGFLVQFTLSLGDIKMHNTIIVKTRDGFAISAEEYVGLETDVRALVIEQMQRQSG